MRFLVLCIFFFFTSGVKAMMGPHIRPISDSVLHKSPVLVDFSNPEHREQIKIDFEIMRRNLHATKGVGIASNQCAEITRPLYMAIVGTAEDDTVKFIAARMAQYPDNRDMDVTNFRELLMINPIVTPVGDETYYPLRGEGCLSVSPHFRAKVPRYSEVDVRYWDLDGVEHSERLRGLMAHVAQHEADHLLGRTYFDKLMALWDVTDRRRLATMIEDHLPNAPDTSLELDRNLLAFDADPETGVSTDWDSVLLVIQKSSQMELVHILNHLLANL